MHPLGSELVKAKFHPTPLIFLLYYYHGDIHAIILCRIPQGGPGEGSVMNNLQMSMILY